MLFIPILKTKQNSETKALKEIICYFSDSIIPYIEVIKSLDNKIVQNIFDILSGKDYFLEVVQNATLNPESILPNQIPVINLSKVSDIENTIYILKKYSKRIGLRIKTGFSPMKIASLQGMVSEDDYIFIDIGESKYESSIQYRKILSKFGCKIIVITDEHKKEFTGSNYEKDSFTELFNTSVIAAIKNNTFNEEGFASYCSAKNNLTDNRPMGASGLYAVFFVYNFELNKFYTFKTSKKYHIGKAYSKLRSELANDEKKKKIKELMKECPKSNEMINKLLMKEKATASAFIAISIVQYFEEISSNLFCNSTQN